MRRCFYSYRYVLELNIKFAQVQIFFSAIIRGSYRQAVVIALAHVDQLGAGAVPCEPEAGRGDAGERDCVRARADAIGDEKACKVGFHGVR